MAENSYFRSAADRDDSFKKFLWNSETGQFLGRTGSSWFKIGVFYVIFYACLAGFFAVMLAIFYQTIDTKHLPKYTPGNGGSILKNPAMGFRPLPRQENVESTLIWYNNGVKDDIKHWVDSLNTFIDPYLKTNEKAADHVVNCQEKTPNDTQVCSFKAEWLSDKCNKTANWGYGDDSPCIILKLNKMIKWEPDVYTSIKDLPDNMPSSLKATIEKSQMENQGNIPKMIWVSCEGENPADQEYIGPIKYSPWQGFPAYYFPYMHNPGYLPPIVAVQFEKPVSNVLINIECRAWAKNIDHDRQRRLGLVHFELLKD